MSNFKSLDDLINGINDEDNNLSQKSNNKKKDNENKSSTSKKDSTNNPTNKGHKKLSKSVNKAIIETYDDKRLVIGVSENKKDTNIFIPENSRYLNTLVIGNKGTGKTECLLPKMVEQDLKGKKIGMTIITTKKEMAYNLYTLAKFYKYKESDIVFLKPSINNTVSNKLLWTSTYSYDFINEFVIDYKEAIKKKKIVIIDMEILKYKSEGLRAVAMLLLQLELDMQETDITQKTPHMVYIDDGQLYLPFLKDIVNNSDNYNLAVTLFIQSRNQLIVNDKDYSKMIDNDFRNILLLNNLTVSDIEYYQNRFNNYDFYGRKFTSILYEILDNSNVRRNGTVQYNPIETEFWDEIKNSSKRNRTRLLNQKRKHREEELKKQLENKTKKIDYNKDPYYNFDKEEDDYEHKNVPNNESSKDTVYKLEEIIKKDDNDKKLEKEENSPKSCTTINKKEEKNNDSTIIIEGKEDIRNIIKTEEKTVKRKLSQEIFNKLNKNIEICSNDFLFSFDD